MLNVGVPVYDGLAQEIGRRGMEHQGTGQISSPRNPGHPAGDRREIGVTLRGDYPTISHRSAAYPRGGAAASRRFVGTKETRNLNKVLRRRLLVGVAALATLLSLSCDSNETDERVPPASKGLSGVWVGVVYDACDIPEMVDPELVLDLVEVDSVIAGTSWIRCGGGPDSLVSGVWNGGLVSFCSRGPEADHEFSGSLVGMNRLEGTYRFRLRATGEYVWSSSWYADRED